MTAAETQRPSFSLFYYTDFNFKLHDNLNMYKLFLRDITSSILGRFLFMTHAEEFKSMEESLELLMASFYDNCEIFLIFSSDLRPTH